MRIFITGAGSGIGRAIALEAAQAGSVIAGTVWNDPDARQSLERAVTEAGGHPHFEDVDVRDPHALEGSAKSAANLRGGLDAWVNCAATLLVRPFAETSFEQWRNVLETNLMGYVHGARVAADHLVDGGSIVNVSSINAVYPAGGLVAYATAKGGVEALTRALAVDLGPRLRVNAVSPGAIDTPLNRDSWSADVRRHYTDLAPLRRIGTPEELARTVLAVAGASMSFVTGQVIVADGGLIVNGTAGHAAG